MLRAEVETLKEEREELRRMKEEKEVVEREAYALREEMRRGLGDWVGMLRLNVHLGLGVTHASLDIDNLVKNTDVGIDSQCFLDIDLPPTLAAAADWEEDDSPDLCDSLQSHQSHCARPQRGCERQSFVS